MSAPPGDRERAAQLAASLVAEHHAGLTFVRCAEVAAFAAAAFAEFITALGKKADGRKRTRRIAKKIAKRGGYLHTTSVGAWLQAGRDS